MQKIINNTRSLVMIAAFTVLLPAMGCNKYLNDPLPTDEITQANAFISDNSVSSVVTGNFLALISNGIFEGSGSSYLGYTSGLYTDELQYINTTAGTTPQLFYLDALQTGSVNYWSTMYTQIYGVNAALTGIQGATTTLFYENQWLGESYFTRGLLYFYLTNLYGAAPLALSTDYTINNVLSRAPQSQVYQQIVSDLQQARSLLNYTYTNAYGAPTTDRVRPDRYSATALLAKVYLYSQKWDSAETMADSVIANAGAYSLQPVTSAFNANGPETIWALEPTVGNETPDYQLYYNGMPAPIPSGKTMNSFLVFACMDTALVNTFEPGDTRFTNWVRADSIAGTSPTATYWFPNKYNTSSLTAQNQIIMRMGELYLIRAEARAEQGNIAGAQSDLNAVRARAGLPATTASDEASLLTAIIHERRVELFTEEGNRFLDLKRWGAIDSVMTAFAPTKGSGTTWSDYKQLLPLPANDLLQDPNLTQNTGYLAQ